MTSDSVYLKLSTLVTDKRIQVRRRGTNHFTVDEYVEFMRQGDSFPPIAVFVIDGENVVADGHHRVEAAKRAGKKSIRANLHYGNADDAFSYALRNNQRNGLRLSVEDKQAAVDRYLGHEEFASYSSRQIARECGVSHTFVNNRRKLIEEGRGRARRDITADPSKELEPQVRHYLRGTPVEKNEAAHKQLLGLSKKERFDAARALASGEASSVSQAIRLREIEKAEEMVPEVSERPVDTNHLVQRHCRQINPGEYRIMFTVDELGRDRLLELAVADGRFTEAEAEERLTLGGKEIGDLMRSVVRDAWERKVRLGLKDSVPQKVVVGTMKKRDMTPEAEAARELAMCMVYVNQVSRSFFMPKQYMDVAERIDSRMKVLYDSDQIWYMLGAARLRSRDSGRTAIKSLVDLQRSIFLVAERLGVDIVAEALGNAERLEC